MSVLSHQTILSLCNLQSNDPEDSVSKTGIIRPCLKGNVRSAGYDLRMGVEYYHPASQNADHVSQPTVQVFNKQHGPLVIHANQLVLITVLEELYLPRNVVGHLSLKVGLLLKGIFFANQSQIDAGYEGKLFVLLYNLSTEPVCIKSGERVLRLELAALDHPTDKPYHGSYSQKSLGEVLQVQLSSSLADIRSTAEDARDAVHGVEKRGFAQFMITLAFIFLSIIGLALAGYGLLYHPLDSIDKTAEVNRKSIEEVQKSVDKILSDRDYQHRIRYLESDDKAILNRIRSVEDRLDRMDEKERGKTQSGN